MHILRRKEPCPLVVHLRQALTDRYGNARGNHGVGGRALAVYCGPAGVWFVNKSSRTTKKCNQIKSCAMTKQTSKKCVNRTSNPHIRDRLMDDVQARKIGEPWLIWVGPQSCYSFQYFDSLDARAKAPSTNGEIDCAWTVHTYHKTTEGRRWNPLQQESKFVSISFEFRTSERSQPSENDTQTRQNVRIQRQTHAEVIA